MLLPKAEGQHVVAHPAILKHDHYLLPELSTNGGSRCLLAGRKLWLPLHHSPVQTIQFTDFNNPTIGYGFYFLLVSTGKRERIVEPLPTDDLEKGVFPDVPCGPDRVSTLSNLQPGVKTRATAATNHSFVCSLTSGVSSAPK